MRHALAWFLLLPCLASCNIRTGGSDRNDAPVAERSVAASVTPASATETSGSDTALRRSFRASAPISNEGSSAGTVREFIPSGDPASSVVMVERRLPDVLIAGEPTTYRLTIRNLTDGTLRAITVEDRLPEGVVADRNGPWRDGALTFTIPTLGPGQQRVAETTLRSDASGTARDAARGCTTVSFAGSVCQPFAAVAPASMALERVAPAEVSACDGAIVRYRVSNRGGATARGLRISEALPTWLSTEAGERSVSLAVPEVAAGASVELSTKLVARAVGTHTSAAQLLNGDRSLQRSDSRSTAFTRADIELKGGLPSAAITGTTVRAAYTVTNVGDTPARNVQVRLPLGALTLVRSGGGSGGVADGSELVWSVGTLAPKAAAAVWADVKVIEGATATEAKATAECSDQASARSSIIAKGLPALLLEVVDDPDPLSVGETTTYTITVTNQGFGDDRGIRVTCGVEDATMRLVSGDGTSSARIDGTTLTFTPVGVLRPKEQARWRVVVKAKATGDTRFSTSMTSDAIKRPVTETESTTVF